MSEGNELSMGRAPMRPWTFLRPVLITIALLVVYYTLPLDRATAGSLLALIAGLAALTALVVWQVRQVLSSNSPRLRAVESLATLIPLYVVLFAGSHFIMSELDPAAFNEPLDRTDSLYFTVTVLGTVGFGDIAPASPAARIAVTLQIVTGLILFGVVIKLFFGAAQIGLLHTGTDHTGTDHTGANRPGADRTGADRTGDGDESPTGLDDRTGQNDGGTNPTASG